MLQQVDQCVILHDLANVKGIRHPLDAVTVEKHVLVLLAVQRAPEALLELADDDLVAGVDELLVVLNVLLQQDLLHIELRQLVGLLLVESLF